ncbi:hypothetical protein BH23CHL8_BH23CHL8_02590 [soil metagenome]
MDTTLRVSVSYHGDSYLRDPSCRRVPWDASPAPDAASPSGVSLPSPGAGTGRIIGASPWQRVSACHGVDS